MWSTTFFAHAMVLPKKNLATSNVGRSEVWHSYTCCYQKNSLYWAGLVFHTLTATCTLGLQLLISTNNQIKLVRSKWNDEFYTYSWCTIDVCLAVTAEKLMYHTITYVALLWTLPTPKIFSSRGGQIVYCLIRQAIANPRNCHFNF